MSLEDEVDSVLGRFQLRIDPVIFSLSFAAGFAAAKGAMSLGPSIAAPTSLTILRSVMNASRGYLLFRSERSLARHGLAVGAYKGAEWGAAVSGAGYVFGYAVGRFSD